MTPAAKDWLELEKMTRRCFAAVDWAVLGDVYFHEDGERHWGERRPLVVELGVQLARRLLRHVAPGGTSLWVGAGVAELPVLLAEAVFVGREVVAANLIAEEVDALNAALQRALPDVPVRYRHGDARDLAGESTFDQLGCISVFTDPERWPALSGVAYGRLPPAQLDVEQFAAEREQARELAAALFARLQTPACITTTADEVAWFLEQAERAGRALTATDDLVETAVVGDPVGFLLLGD